MIGAFGVGGFTNHHISDQTFTFYCISWNSHQYQILFTNYCNYIIRFQVMKKKINFPYSVCLFIFFSWQREDIIEAIDIIWWL